MKNIVFTSAISAVAIAMCFSAANANELRHSKDLEVSASVKATCYIDTVGPVDFGTFDANATFANQLKTANVKVVCPGQDYNVTADKGENGTSPDDRKLKVTGGTATLSYQLYTSNSYATVWSEAINGHTINASALGGLTGETYTFGAKLFGATPTVSGVYKDKVVVSVYY